MKRVEEYRSRVHLQQHSTRVADLIHSFRIDALSAILLYAEAWKEADANVEAFS